MTHSPGILLVSKELPDGLWNNKDIARILGSRAGGE